MRRDTHGPSLWTVAFAVDGVTGAAVLALAGRLALVAVGPRGAGIVATAKEKNIYFLMLSRRAKLFGSLRRDPKMGA